MVYGLILALVSVLVVIVLLTMGRELQNIVSNVVAALGFTG